MDLSRAEEDFEYFMSNEVLGKKTAKSSRISKYSQIYSRSNIVVDEQDQIAPSKTYKGEDNRAIFQNL